MFVLLEALGFIAAPAVGDVFLDIHSTPASTPRCWFSLKRNVDVGYKTTTSKNFTEQ